MFRRAGFAGGNMPKARLDRQSYLTLLVVSDPVRPSVSIRIPLALIRAFVCFLILFISVLSIYTIRYRHLQVEAEVADRLRLLSQIQDRQLGELAAEVEEFRQTLLNLAEVDHQVRLSLGLDPAQTTLAGGLGGPSNPSEDYPKDDGVLAAGFREEDGQESLARIASVMHLLDEMHQECEVRESSLESVHASRGTQIAEDGELPVVWPVANAYISSSFGYRRSPTGGYWEHHNGLDLAAPTGTPIVASAGGTIIFVGRLPYYGETVEIDHGNGITSLYGHCSNISVETGERVQQRQIVAYIGSTGRSTGPHVHYEVRENGQPVDPLKYLKRDQSP